MKLIWFGYLVYILGNCVMKVCIETSLINTPSGQLSLGVHKQISHTKEEIKCSWLNTAAIESDTLSFNSCMKPCRGIRSDKHRYNLIIA